MRDKLDNTPGSRPLYAQVYEILVEKLESGEYVKEDILPTESQFQELFGISRITARKALAKLTEDGYVKRARGIGTIVIKNSKDPKINIKTKIEGSKTEKITRKILTLKKVYADKEVAKSLEIEVGTEVTFIERVLICGKKPVVIHYVYLSPVIEIELTKKELDGSLYSRLDKEGYNVERYKEYLKAVIPTKREMELLELKEIKALLQRERISSTVDGEKIEYSIAKHISEGYEYIIELN